jgi:hypothetical protein
MSLRAMILYDSLSRRDQMELDHLARVFGLPGITVLDVYLDVEDFVKEKLGLDLQKIFREVVKPQNEGPSDEEKKYLLDVGYRLAKMEGEYLEKRAKAHRVDYRKYRAIFFMWLAADEVRSGRRVFKALEAYLKSREETVK